MAILYTLAHALSIGFANVLFRNRNFIFGNHLMQVPFIPILDDEVNQQDGSDEIDKSPFLVL